MCVTLRLTPLPLCDAMTFAAPNNNIFFQEQDQETRIPTCRFLGPNNGINVTGTSQVGTGGSLLVA
jgi:hypothetical protein